MELKEIFADQFEICAVTNRSKCAFEDELFSEVEDAYQSSRENLIFQLEALSREGFASEQYTSRRVDKKYDIWELKADKLRAIYFKGNHPNIIVCTDLHVKQSKKVNPKSVKKAINFKKLYLAAIENKKLIISKDENHEDEQ